MPDDNEETLMGKPVFFKTDWPFILITSTKSPSPIPLIVRKVLSINTTLFI
jgi:hypothetical protein